MVQGQVIETRMENGELKMAKRKAGIADIKRRVFP
jgi:hypothetical protein